ncbi:hypothetical protein [Pyrococcus kukulkanii]|uniref:Uncharacterized protein n=1 Tax=Pyrococcus kukulkanii TaxID=1609559 RepID=A0ABV4T8G6_9EURY
MKKLLSLFVVVVLVLSVSVVRGATITNVTWENAITEPEDLPVEIVEGQPAAINVTILASSGEPFVLENLQGADSISVTGKFIDEYGNALDMNGDGAADIYTFTNTSTPGLYTTVINVTNVQPGLYTLKIEAIASNSTTNTIIDNATLELQVWIAGGPYWVLRSGVRDGDTIQVGSMSITIRGLSDLGAILDLGNLTTQSIIDNDRDGIFSWKHDISGDGVDDWMVFIKSTDEKGRSIYNLYIYSKDASILDSLNNSLGEVRVLGNDIRRTVIFKDHNRYNAFVLWDESLPAKLGLKATDYYIIPVQGRKHWWERGSRGAHMEVKVIKRTTYLWGLFGKEEKVFEGDIWNRNVNVDNVVKILGKWTLQLGNIMSNCWWSQGHWFWEIKKALGDIQFPNNYELRSRELKDLAYSSEDWRGFNPILNPSGKGLFKPNLDWKSILGIEDEEEE